LELVLRKDQKALDTLRAWHRPDALEVLHGSPVNCLIVSWAGNVSEDTQQQRTLAPLIGAARERGLKVLGLVAEGVDEQRSEASARAAGCEGVIRETVKGVWPGVQTGHGSEASSAGPTGAPWIDSNGWTLRLAAARQPGAPGWLWFDPPEDQELRPESYLVAAADAAAFGGRWVVSLQSTLRSGISARSAEALETWSRLAKTLSFFEEHAGWRDLSSRALLGILSDFSGDNEALAGEVLNLSTRRGLH
jgi:hypothetical protein